MNGIEFRKKIPDETPCYLFSGEPEIENTQDFIEVLQKPLEFEKLQEVLDTIRQKKEVFQKVN